MGLRLIRRNVAAGIIGLAAILFSGGCNVSPKPVDTCDERRIAEEIIRDARQEMGSIERAFWLDVMEKYGKPKGISLPLLASVGVQESKFRPGLVSSVGARGVFQVMPEWVGKPECPKRVEDLFDVESNTRCAVNILVADITKGGGVEVGLRRYAAGPHKQGEAQWYSDQVLARIARSAAASCPRFAMMLTLGVRG
jgi:hypothetical protein